MARMIPDTIGPDAPPGEHDLFAKLRDAPGTTDWIAFHSLNIAQHATQVEGETDFVVLVPGEGVLVIEVKSHLRVEATGDGYWKLGNDRPSRKSPFDQASGSMHSIQDYLSGRITTAGYPLWNCVWFTAVSKADLPASIGWQQWMMLDADDLKGDVAAKIVSVLRTAAEHLEERAPGFHRKASKPTATDVAELVAVLEPRFVAEATPEELRRSRRLAVDRFSAEQVQILDALVDVPRLLVDGPTGSGKSVVAIEAAKRAASAGKSALIVASNPRLVAALRAQLPGVDALTLAELAERPNDRWDFLVVDDAHLVTEASALDTLDGALTGGLATGASVVAGTFDDASKQAWLDRIPSAVPLRLTEVFGATVAP